MIAVPLTLTATVPRLPVIEPGCVAVKYAPAASNNAGDECARCGERRQGAPKRRA